MSLDEGDFLQILQEAIFLGESRGSTPLNQEMKLSEDDISVFSNQKLCSIIASNRYLKMNSGEEIMCMKELAKRRSGGDNFLFEKQINEYVTKFTPIETNIPGIMSMVSGLIKKI
jgi:hypothetical protein